MFAIIVLYLLVWVSFVVFKKKHLAAIGAAFALTLVYIFVIKKYKPAYWYDTVLTLPLGMLYSYFKEPIEKFFKKNDIIYYISTGVVLCAFLLTMIKNPQWALVIRIIRTLIFALLMVLITFKVKIGNRVLTFFGRHVFSVYILQRIPFALFGQIDAVSSNRYLWFFLSLGLTVGAAVLFDKAMGAFDKLVFLPKKAKN